MKVLIVLDINGIVCNKTQEGIRISNYYCIKPIDKYMEFIEELCEDYNIAWFTSTTERNASNILKVLGLYDIDSIFKWYRNMTDNDGTIKSLDKVKYHYPLFDKYIIIDDSYDKISCNLEDERIVHVNYIDSLNIIRKLTRINEDHSVWNSKERE